MCKEDDINGSQSLFKEEETEPIKKQKVVAESGDREQSSPPPPPESGHVFDCLPIVETDPRSLTKLCAAAVEQIPASLVESLDSSRVTVTPNILNSACEKFVAGESPRERGQLPTPEDQNSPRSSQLCAAYSPLAFTPITEDSQCAFESPEDPDCAQVPAQHAENKSSSLEPNDSRSAKMCDQSTAKLCATDDHLDASLFVSEFGSSTSESQSSEKAEECLHRYSTATNPDTVSKIAELHQTIDIPTPQIISDETKPVISVCFVDNNATQIRDKIATKSKSLKTPKTTAIVKPISDERSKFCLKISKRLS